MHTTVREDTAVAYDASAIEPAWALALVHHRAPEALGTRRVVLPGASLGLGRACAAFGEGLFDDPQVSRAHCRIEVDGRGSLTVSDLGSANGTWVDGERVGALPLRAGAVLRVGPALFVVQHAPATYPLRRSSRCPAVAWPTASFLDRLRARLGAGGAVRIRGAPRAAWWPYVELVAEELGRPAASLDVAEGDDDLAMPALADRLEDLPWLARSALERALGRAPEMDAGFVTRLLLAAWPEDVAGLARWAEAVARRPERHGRLTWVGEDLALTGGPRRAPDEPAAPPPAGEPGAVVARDGTWFRVGGEGPVDLRTRFALARVLRALVAAHAREPGAALPLEALIDAGWPREQLVADSGANRAYVAVATLRKLGLRDLIERCEGGYRLARHAPLTLADGAPERPEERAAHG